MKTTPIFQKFLISFLGLLLSIAVGHAKINEENQRVIAQLNEKTNILKKEGLSGFLVYSVEREWQAPKMYSAWFIGKMPDDPEGKKLVELAKSTFGQEVARQLTSVAKAVRETKVAAKLETQLELLFAVIGWLGTEIGYANILLQDRADDIASIAATKLMADINYPMEKAEKAMRRFEDRSWGSAERCRQVLFEESKGTHFFDDGSPITAEKLDREFREGVDLVLKLDDIAGRPDLEIFTEEVYLPGDYRGDLENTWSKRDHIQFGEAGFGSVNWKNLTQLHEFRIRYGKYPTKPEIIQPFPGESKVKAAFREISWENPYGIGGAWATFEAYIEDRLVDEVFHATDRRFSPNAR